MGEELGAENDGSTIAAVHLGHHHGTDGALLVLTALLLSRVAIERRGFRIATFAYLGTMLAYGGVNFVQDAWNEQVVKRGWTDAGIPSALLPGVKPIWGVVILLAVAATLVLLREEKSDAATVAATAAAL
jgi:TRAP-type C4-dicarboxylate transport system permease small subunit